MKTIALTCILKNEVHNLPRFCESVAGCFDEYHFTDTGSDDGSVAWLIHDAEKHLKCRPDQLKIHHFKWIDDFAAARNYAIDQITTDYWAWLDLDDVLYNKEAFLAFRKESIGFSDFFYVPYHYALKEDGEPRVSFIRERIVKTDTGLRFQDFVHEGIDIRKAKRNLSTSAINSFSVKHMRTEKEMLADKGRNISLLEKNKDKLSPRLQFYYGKELFDMGKHKECAEVLKENVKVMEMEQGDRILAFQYLTHSLTILGDHVNAIKYGIISIQMEPNRAEYYCLVGENFLKIGEPHKAVPFFAAAKYCTNVAKSGLSHEFTHDEGYSLIPRMNLAQIFTNQGLFENALEELQPVSENPEAKKLIDFCSKAILYTTIPPDSELEVVDDIVITCPFKAAYPWDEEIYKNKGLGGSETAAVEMSMHLKKLTGKRVIIFQERSNDWTAESGVEYKHAHELHGYFRKYKPKLHIAWRHASKFTNAYTVLWSHDLITPGVENHQNYDHILALSEAHKNMIIGQAGIPEEKIIITRNGIDPSRFNLKNNIDKEYGRVIWPNSPDRGLEWAIKVMDLVVKEIPEATLHVYYGLENLKKFGLKDKAESLEKMFNTRRWLRYHGNVPQDRLAQDFMKSEVWLYTSNFFETFCITALESMASGAWPVLRKFGALKDTLSPAIKKDMCDIIDCDMNDDVVPLFAEKVVEAIKQSKWKKMDFGPEQFSWEGVAKEWIQTFQLE